MPTSRPAHCVSRSVRPHSLSRSFWVCTAFIWYSHSSTQPASLGKRCCAWRNMPMTPRSLSSLTMFLGRCASGLARCRLPASTWRKAPHAIRQTGAARSCSAWASIRELAAAPMPRRPSGCWGTQSKRWPLSTRLWRWHTSCRIPILWHMCGVGRPSSISFAWTYRPCMNTQRPPLRSRPSRVFHFLWPVERACVGGLWLCRARVRRGWPMPARELLPGGRPAQQCSLHTCAPCWRRLLDHLGYLEDGLQALAEAHTLVEQHEERWWEAEIHRLRGVLLLRQPGT